MLYRTNEHRAPSSRPPSAISIDQGNGRALRYGIGVGREGFRGRGWSTSRKKKE